MKDESVIGLPGPVRQPYHGRTDATGLTLMQKAVLRRLLRGEKTRDIARALSIDPKSVHSRTTAVRRKFGLADRDELLAWARAHLDEENP